MGCELPPKLFNIHASHSASVALAGTTSTVGNASPSVSSFNGGLSKTVRTRRAAETWMSRSKGTENQFTEMAGRVKGLDVWWRCK